MEYFYRCTTCLKQARECPLFGLYAVLIYMKEKKRKQNSFKLHLRGTEGLRQP